MASWTTPVIHAEGDDLAVTDWNGVANNETFLYQKPYALYAANTAQSIATGQSQLTLGATPVSGYGFSLSSNSAVIPLTGVYTVGFSGGMAANSNLDPCNSILYQNGTLVLAGGACTPNVTVAVGSPGGGLLYANVGDHIALWMYNGIGGPADTAAVYTWLHISFVGSQ